jgi:hypothetical protein
VDADTLKLLIPAAAALLGAVIGGLSAYGVARANISGQRQIARDNALREHRKGQLQSLRDLANGRLGAYRNMLHAGIGLPLEDDPTLTPEQRRSRRVETFQRAWDGLYREGDMLGDMAHASVTDAAVLATIKALFDADRVARRKVMAIVPQFREPPTEPAEQQRWRKAIETAVNPMSDAIIAFGLAADRYVYGPEPVSWWQRALYAVKRQPPALLGRKV